jgi:hypothetical protein
MAARTTPREVQVDLDPDMDPDLSEVTSSADLGFSAREVVVEPVAPPTAVDQSGRVQIRMARTIEEFTYGNPHQHSKLEEGKLYLMPVDIARYLWGIGALSNVA